MASPRNTKQAMVSTIKQLINIGADEKARLVIVDITIFERLLNFIPLEHLQQFIAVELSDAPQTSEDAFKLWVNQMRGSLTQKQYAERLVRHCNIKVHASDIGNIETGGRQEDYTPERLNIIREAIIKLNQMNIGPETTV